MPAFKRVLARRPDTRQRVVLATNNPGKVAEYRELLADTGAVLLTFDPDVDETGGSYEENALLKARAAAEATGLPALADDTGLEVEALNGEPGLRSRRLAPTQPERNQVLMERLRDVPRPWGARFVCAIALVTPDGAEQTFRGEATGELTENPRGEHGFGYDSIFVPEGETQTFAELPPEAKQRLGHRGRAVRGLLQSGFLERVASN
ncbi:MAG TPA: RdgB/HAM1 family non-canonical purine NTP pyrophosphatase [Candidatus Dormibacteraeota bacterium]